MKENYFLKILLLLLLTISLIPGVLAQGRISELIENYEEGMCYFVSEVSVMTFATIGYASCIETANPVACSLATRALDCSLDPACSDVVARFTDLGCRYTLRKVGDVLQFTGAATKEFKQELVETYDALNSVEGMHFLMKYFSQ